MNESRSFVRRWAAPLGLGLLTGAGLAWPAHGEAGGRDEVAIFAEAARYTVRIRSSAQIGLGNDEEGAWFGAGFLVDRGRGWVLTNGHVSGRSPGAISVSFRGAAAIPARRVFVDTHLDLAVVAVPPAALPADAVEATLDCGGPVAAGTPVGAFGHPWSLPFTATRGIVSARQYLRGQESLQTDAPLNPGNSGGPLISLASGRVVGINQARLRGEKEKAEGLGFAVPAPFACRIVDLMAAGRDPAAPSLDVAFAETEEPGMLVVAQTLAPGWAALAPGDRIVAVNGTRGLENPSGLVHALRGRPGPAVLTVERDGALLEATVTPHFDPALLARPAILFGGIAVVEPWRLQDGADRTTPVALAIDDVLKSSMARTKGLRSEQAILRVDGRALASLDALWAYLSELPKPASVTLLVREWSSDPMRLYGYRQVSVEVEDLTRIRGDQRLPEAAVALAGEGGR